MTQVEIKKIYAKKTENDLVNQFERKHPADRQSVRDYVRILTKHDELEREAGLRRDG